MGRKQSEIKLNKIRLSNTDSDIGKKRNNRSNNYKNNDSQVTSSYRKKYITITK